MSETIRLLQCVDCKTIEVLPGYRGPAQHDEALSYLVQRHRFPDGSEHRGNLIPAEVSTNDGGLRPATMDDWKNPKFQELVKENISKSARPGQGTGLGMQFYDTRDTFRDDAMACWKSKLKPAPYCPEYKSDRKKLVPDTAKLRKAEGLGKTTVSRSLCEFCPVHSMVQAKQRQNAGLDK